MGPPARPVRSGPASGQPCCDPADPMNPSRWRRGPHDVQSTEARGEQERARVVPLTPLDDSAYPDWDSAYLDNVGRLYRLMYAKVGNRPDAEDLTSEVFRAALGPLRLTASKGEVRAYLLATARTVLAAHWRRHFGMSVTSIDEVADAGLLAEPSTMEPLG